MRHLRCHGLCFGLIGFSLILLANGGNLAAQEPETARQPDTVAGAKADADLWERLIYIPFKNLQKAFENQNSSVMIPYAEYVQLWKAAHGKHLQAQELPAVITETNYVAKIDQDVARIQADLHVKVLAEKWVEVPISFGQAAVGKMTATDDAILLRGTGNGTYGLLFPKAGEYTVQLELLAKVQTSPDGRRFDMNCPSVAITTLEVIVPEVDQTIEVSPRQVSLPVEAAEGETRVKATLGSTPLISTIWHPRASQKPEMELLASVTNHSRISYDDGLLRTDAFLSYEVLRGEMDQIRLVVPLGDRILDITSPNARVKSWQTVEEENRQIITVEFLGTIEKQVTIEVHTERSVPAESAAISGISEDGVVSGIHALDAVRESGQLVVANSPSITLAVDDQSGLIRVAENDVAESIRAANSLYFKFYSPRYALKVTARPVQPHVMVNHRTRLRFDDDEILIVSELNYTIERAGIFEVKLRVPELVEIDRVDGSEVKEHTFDEESRTLTVVFTAKKEEAATVIVSAKRPLDDVETSDEAPAEEATEEGAGDDAESADEPQLQLPILEPLGVAREDGTIAVHAPESLEVITDERKLISAQPDPAANAEASPGYRLASAWIYHRRPVEIWVRTTRKPTRLLADLGTTISVKESLIEVRHQLTYTVQYAGIDTFLFSVPEAVAAKVQVRSLGDSSVPAIKQQSKADTAQEGWVTWTVILQRDHVGTIPLEITYDIPSETKQGKPSSLTFSPLRVLDLPAIEGKNGAISISRVVGEIAVQKERALSVVAIPTGDALEPIDVRELRLLSGDASLAFRYFTQPVEMKLDAAKYDIQEVVQTVVSRALVEIVAGKDDRLAHRCRYQLKSSERQRLRIDLPEGVEPLSILVDRKPVSLEKNASAQVEAGWTSYFLNVSRAKSSDETFSVTLQYLLPANPKPFENWGGRLNIPLPRIGGAEAAAVAVQQLKTVIWVPDEYSIVRIPDRFTRDAGSRPIVPIFGTPRMNDPTNDLAAWVGEDSGNLFDFPTAGHAYRFGNLGGTDEISVTWWNVSTYSWILSGAALLIGWILRKSSWENKLGLLLFVAFVAALWALRDADFVMYVYIAMRYGLLAMITLWVIHSLLGENRFAFASSAASTAATSSASNAAQTQTPPAVIPPPEKPTDEPNKKDDSNQPPS